MAVAYMYQIPQSGEEYHRTVGEIFTGTPPPGLLIHSAGTGDDGSFYIVEVWEDEDAMTRFGDEVVVPSLKRHHIDTSAAQRTRIQVEYLIGPAAALAGA